MRKTASFFVFVFLCCQFVSCDILRERAFEILSWTPGSGVQEAPDYISLYFSHEPDQLSVERAFSFTEDGGNVRGRYLWEGKRLSFYPDRPLLKNKDYTLNLSVEAKSVSGISLEKKFEGKFSTRSDETHPFVTSIYPSDESVIDDLYSAISIQFSMAIDLLSCINEIKIEPHTSGVWHMENENTRAVFENAASWQAGKTYKITISPYFQSSGGKISGKTFEARFTAAGDKRPPVLEKIYALDAQDRLVFDLIKYAGTSPVDVITENSLWEAEYKLKLQFNKNIDTSVLKTYLVIDPALKYDLEPPFAYTSSVLVRFIEKPAWKSRFNIKINAGIPDSSGNKSSDNFLYRIYANGPFSMPPQLLGVRLAKNPRGDHAAPSYTIITKDDLFKSLDIQQAEYPFDLDIETWVELYFDTAPDAEPDLFSVRDLLTISSTNNALSFVSKKIIGRDFTVPEAAPELSGKKRIEIQGVLRNSSNFGLITFAIGKGLLDTKQNRNPVEMRIQAVK
ncbi:MAG: Ig-like domain-containing protein [Spirochaetaceae bacterium]|jgi:hypothetical protein|nr:Ig-like domain-containing protein [Spirochaetaceae bacterium]